MQGSFVLRHSKARNERIVFHVTTLGPYPNSDGLEDCFQSAQGYPNKIAVVFEKGDLPDLLTWERPPSLVFGVYVQSSPHARPWWEVSPPMLPPRKWPLALSTNLAANGSCIGGKPISFAQRLQARPPSAGGAQARRKAAKFPSVGAATITAGPSTTLSERTPTSNSAAIP